MAAEEHEPQLVVGDDVDEAEQRGLQLGVLGGELHRLADEVAIDFPSVGAVVALAPETGGRLEGAAARNWSPLYRLRGAGDGDDGSGVGADGVAPSASPAQLA